ncbi:MAG: hypothetical protein NZ920_04235 [Aigarchaeota archaeon]|nr:hypothetical protein [Aigarchaeota archaeon]MDW8092170.1 hypothetical protein [Nitrososphaerota archaeon]
MQSFRLNVSIRNHPDAVAKLMLLIKQGQLSLKSMNLVASDDGTLRGQVEVVGQYQKVLWLSRKSLSFPVLESVTLQE